MNTRFTFLLLFLLISGSHGIVSGGDYDTGDFAVEVVYFQPGIGIPTDRITGQQFNDPNAALGRPVIDSTGDNWSIPLSRLIPVNPLYPAFRSYEIVTIGYGGELVLKFNHPVSNDANNPFGIDFIIFGNSMNQSANGILYNGNDPNGFGVSSKLSGEYGIVSVSQDGIVWQSFTDGPYADSFAPTLGRTINLNTPDPGLGSWNQWWGEPTNPTLPLDPNFQTIHSGTESLLDLCKNYGQSAGGTGFDLERLTPPLSWFQYIKVEAPSNGNTPEIDAVADVACCGDYRHPVVESDIDGNCLVDIDDLCLLTDNWLNPKLSPATENTPIFNVHALALISADWLSCSWDCP